VQKISGYIASTNRRLLEAQVRYGGETISSKKQRQTTPLRVPLDNRMTDAVNGSSRLAERSSTAARIAGLPFKPLPPRQPTRHRLGGDISIALLNITM